MNKKTSKIVINENDITDYVNPKFLSIGWRFLLYFLLVSLLPVLIFGYSIISKSQFELKNQIQNRLESIAILKNSQLKFWMDNNKVEFQGLFDGRDDLMLLIGQMMAEKSNQNRDLLRSEMNQILKSEHFIELFLIDLGSGKVLVSTNSISEGLDTSDKDYFIEGKKGFFEGKVYYSTDFMNNALTISMPIKNKDEKLLGVLAAHVDLKVLYYFLSEKSGLGNTGEIYMVSRFYNRIPAINYSDGQGDKFVIGPKNEKLIYTEGVKRALGGESGLSMYKNYDDKDVIGYFRFFPDLGLVFLVEQGADEAFAPITSMKNTLFVVFLIILFASTVLRKFEMMDARLFIKSLSSLKKGPSSNSGCSSR